MSLLPFFPPQGQKGGVGGKKCGNETESALKLLNGFDHTSKTNQELLSASVCLLQDIAYALRK